MKFNVAIILTFFAFILLAVMIFLNYRATSLPLNGKSTGELSDQYPNLFVPAGLTFSIWGIIYILLTIFSISYIIKAFKD
ncbi:MAG: hypothetical protein ACK4YF_06020, partial [Exilispira sp.]